uniref:ADP-ribosylation factor-like protein 16 isoform X1 n=2 Tax=Monopterus albus TaxID=43700 RepID=UPI0009B44B7C|nr:ADP-ribosylation factor-like protein 16 isoform X1 [Monopterus albus]XP_020466094.1 ADP-ribosylation factor-like protein 16 isoform X1 [Monopterus albus]XP_020466095.1 ADP-ribosylation factor-like protein 16 isoform X1 [Monopterus albus]
MLHVSLMDVFSLCMCCKTEMSSNEICLLLGATGVGKTLLLKRLQKLSLHGLAELGPPPPTHPTVGTNLTDLTLKRKKKVTVRELGGCMGPIWPSYFEDCSSVIFMVDSANISQVSSSCIQLLTVLSAEPLHSVSVLILFNKKDMPCTMTLTEIKSLFRMDDIIASATQPITTLELSACTGQGLQDVLSWLESITVK